MAKDPAFLFYPGDYLKDTQCLSANSQVAYDRIMCEHMRNICISKQQLNFFTKTLNEEEKEEINMVLKEVEGGFQIEWVAISISQRKSYSESRRKNRNGKKNNHMYNTYKTYDSHMENAIENVNEDVIVLEIENKNLPQKNFEFGEATRREFSLEQCVIEFEYFNLVQSDAQLFFDHYNSQGWVKANGQRITNLKSLVSNWVKNPPDHAKKKVGKHSQTILAAGEFLQNLKAAK